MKLTKLIFEYWEIWMTIPVETNIWANEVLDEGFCYADGFCVTFWWILNQEWYRMQNKMYSYTGCEYLYIEPTEIDEVF